MENIERQIQIGIDTADLILLVDDGFVLAGLLTEPGLLTEGLRERTLGVAWTIGETCGRFV
ncbi:MAG: hypothetical protein NT013_27550 [Planctomycetia bacterium]|nr:hypothetical protein [Planctomycetia bacterium]